LPPNPNPNPPSPHPKDHPEKAKIVESSRGKKKRCVKPKTRDIFIDWEEDFQWQDTMDMAVTVLVGRVRGRNYSAARLKQWVTEIWGHHLDDLPIVQTFVCGWFSLRFA